MKKWKFILLSTILTGACALGMNGCANAKSRMPERNASPYSEEQTMPSAETESPDTTPDCPDCPDGKECPHCQHGHRRAPHGKGTPHRNDGKEHRPTPLPAPAPDGTEKPVPTPRTDNNAR